MSNLFWLTDEQMARLQPYFPKSHGRQRVDDRRVLSGIIFVNRNGLRYRVHSRSQSRYRTLGFARRDPQEIFTTFWQGLKFIEGRYRTAQSAIQSRDLPVHINEINASHEIGHYLLARHNKFPVKSISIMHGDRFQPIMHFQRRKEPTIELSLAGWAGEAHLKAHGGMTDVFNRRRFCLKLLSSGCGSGWPHGFFATGKNDIRDLLNEGIRPSLLIAPVGTLLRVGKLIHGERDLFWRLMEKLTSKSYLSEKALIVVVKNEAWTSAVEGENELSKMRAYAPKGMSQLFN